MENEEEYKEFLLVEYEQVANAYFNTTSLISYFFRYYILIITLPAPFIALIGKIDDAGKINPLLRALEPLIPIAMIVVAFLGLCVLVYLSHLRAEGLLYVRHVNGIREYFSWRIDLDKKLEANTRVLSRDNNYPPYYEHSFLSVVYALSLINSLYLVVGIWLLLKKLDICKAWLVMTTIIGGIAFFVLSRFFYCFICKYWEKISPSGVPYD